MRRPSSADDAALIRPPSTGQRGAAFGVGLHRLDVGSRREALLVVPPEVASPAPLIVFFHGAGGQGSRSLPLVRDVATDHGCLALAPTSVSSTWDVIAGGWGADVRQVERALDMLFERADIGPVAFAGFSDGASYALSLGLANGGLAEAVLAFSPGFEAAPQRVGRPRIWISHGTDDTVLPIDRCSRKLVRRLSSENYEVHYEEFGGGHVVPPWAVTDAFAWWLGA